MAAEDKACLLKKASIILKANKKTNITAHPKKELRVVTNYFLSHKMKLYKGTSLIWKTQENYANWFMANLVGITSMEELQMNLWNAI